MLFSLTFLVQLALKLKLSSSRFIIILQVGLGRNNSEVIRYRIVPCIFAKWNLQCNLNSKYSSSLKEICSVLRAMFRRVRLINLSRFCDLNSFPKDQKIESGAVKDYIIVPLVSLSLQKGGSLVVSHSFFLYLNANLETSYQLLSDLYQDN